MGEITLIIVVDALIPKGLTMEILNTKLANMHVDASGKDAAGNKVPLPVPATVVWSSSDASIMTVEPSADGSTCIARTVDGAVGTATILVTDPPTGTVAPATTFEVVAAVLLLSDLSVTVDSIVDKI